MLYATVRNRKIHVKKPDTVVQNGVKVDWLQLEMDDEWAEMDSIVCVFVARYTEEQTGDGGTKTLVEQEIKKEMLHTFGQKVLVPWEVLVNSGMLSVSCTGYVGSEKIMTTMYPDSFWEIVQNGPKSGDSSIEPTPSLYDQILAASGAANAAAIAATQAREQLLQDKANGVFNGADGQAATVEVGTVITGSPEENAQVYATGTPQEVRLNFVLPRGKQGPRGEVNPSEITQAVENYMDANPIQETDPTVPAWAKQPTKPTYTAAEVGALPDTYTPPNQTAQQVGADPAGTAASAVSQHNTDATSHNDLRLALQELSDRINAALDSDDTTLDQMSEVVAYIKSNKSMIDAITTSKVSVADIVDNLTTNVSNKPLSAAQGVVIKTLIDALRNDKLDAAELTNAVNTALAQAKASGEFDGADGAPGKDGQDGQPGKDGTSPVISVSAITGGNRITITDVNGTKTVDVMDGSDGKNGADGKPGENGTDGYSPTANVTQNDNGATITITDKNGTTTATVKNGKDGADGNPGADGSPGKDGQPGKDGVGIQSVVQTTTSTADGGDNVFTVTLTNGTSATFTVKNGRTGSTGDPGSDGAPGAKGDKGDTGPAGQSAYAAAQAGGYTDTQANFYADLAAMQGLASALAAI